MIRVLQVIDNMNFGGMETMIMNYYRQIDKKNIQFDFMIFHNEKCFYEDEIKNLGGQIYKLTSRRKNFLKNRIEVKNFFKQKTYDIVEFHQGITYYYPLKMAKKYGVKSRIVHNHGINVKYLKYLKIYNEIWAKKRICSLANFYFTCSNEVANHLFTNDILGSFNMVIYNNAIDVERFRYSSKSREKIRKEFNISDDTILIGHVGTFTFPKNHLFLLNVFNELIKHNKKYKLLLVGVGPLKDEILKRVKDFNLNEYVIFASNRNDVNDILSAFDIMLFPSLFEGIPLTLIEAQASGLPLIISNTINIKTIVAEENIKILSLNNPISTWVNEITNMNYNINREKYNKIMQSSIYSINRESQRIASIYKGLATRKELDLKQIQNEEFLLLKKTISFFDKHNINYYLYGGTLLGAVRHNGFIPWDDDVDIIMPRPDYEKFVNMVHEENYFMDDFFPISYEINNADYPFCKILNKNIVLDCNNQINKFLWIDIFPVDGIPNNCNPHEYLKMINKKRMLYGKRRDQVYCVKGNNKFKDIIKNIIRFPLRFLDLKKIIHNFVILCKSQQYDNSKYVCDLVWASHNGNILKKEWLDNTVKVTFDGIEANAFAGYKDYLKNRYGENYMEIPPENMRITHSFKAWRIDDEK